MMGIYKITNQLNGMVYIGQSNDIERRWREHKKPSERINPTKKLYIAFNEYGLENFSFDVIEECSEKELLLRESYWIDYYDSSNEKKGYNMQAKQSFRNSYSNKTVLGIVEDLIEQKLSNKEIADKWGVDHSYVSNVNSGKIRYNKNLSYPLRPIVTYNTTKNYCVDCGVEIYRGATRCTPCYKANKRKNSKIPKERDELKRLIRNTSFTQIGRDFGVTKNAVVKWCKSYNLPSTKREINSYSDEEWTKI